MRAKINLLPAEIRAKRKAEMLILGVVSAAVVFAVILMMVYGLYFIQTLQAQAKLDQIKRANDELAKVTNDLQVFRRRQDQLEKQKNLILSLQKMQIDWADLFNDIALILPNEVWLTEIKATIPNPGDSVKPGSKSSQTVNEIKLAGFSIKGQGAIAKTLTRLSDVQMLKNVSLNFSQESNFGQKRLIQFEIKAELNLPEELIKTKPAEGTGTSSSGASSTGQSTSSTASGG